MLFPKKVKFRKWQTKRSNPKKIRVASRGATVAFGSFGLKVEKSGRITSNQIEAARKAMSKAIGKTGRIWIRIFPDRPYTAKPAEVGMGKGKGDPVGYVAEVRPGTIIFEMDGIPDSLAKEALRKASSKISVKTKAVSR